MTCTTGPKDLISNLSYYSSVTNDAVSTAEISLQRMGCEHDRFSCLPVHREALRRHNNTAVNQATNNRELSRLRAVHAENLQYISALLVVIQVLCMMAQ